MTEAASSSRAEVPAPPPAGGLIFAGLALDPAAQQLWCDGRMVLVRPRTYAVLQYLAERRGELVRKRDLIAAIWPGLFVTDAVLAVCISELRKALGDPARAPRFIETVHRHGYRFIAPRAGRWLDCGLPGAAAALVGRRAELEQLDQHLALALAGERQLVFLTGEAGIGKSALVDVFLQRVAANASSAEAHSACCVARGQCIETVAAPEPHLPVLEALTRLASGSDAAGVAPLLRTHMPSWLRQMPGVPRRPEREALQNEGGAGAAPSMLRELTLGLEALTRERPLILVLGDLQWSDAATIDLLAALAHHRQPARLLMLASYRPQEIRAEHPLRRLRHELDRKRLCRELALPPLGESEVAAYLAYRLGHAGLSSASAGLVHRECDGSPQLLVALAEQLLAEGAPADAEALERRLPHAVRVLVERQLGTCTDDERRLLDAASCMGTEFSVSALASSAGADPGAVARHCDDLLRRCVLQRLGMAGWPDSAAGQRYRFRHRACRDVLHEQLPLPRRRVLQRRVRKHNAGSGQIAGGPARHVAAVK